ncbi:MAG TPA: MBL fold metallo-hydrolase [Acidimicrobiia bacterium]|nr:MBL fold metallo-hydrolase [Acidimicrobiia bacterium]
MGRGYASLVSGTAPSASPTVVLPADGGPIDGFDTGALTFIGTATVLVQYAGFRFLTDPNFLHQGQHAYIGLGLSTRRRTEPAMQPRDLPPLDFVVLSHHHGDHFDRIAAQELDKDVPIITNRRAAKKLRQQGFRRPIALETWEAQRVERGDNFVRITSMPGKHAPQPLGLGIPDVMGSMLEFGRAGDVALRLYITGDTLLHDRLEEIPRRYPDIDLCLIHLGGTRVAGILLTMNAEQGVRALQLIAPKVAVPIHYDDYTVFKEPLDAFKEAAARASLRTTIHYVARGDTYRFVRGDHTH